MCRIIRYLDRRQVPEVLVEGISKLEYRGCYLPGVAVSAGITYQYENSKVALVY